MVEQNIHLLKVQQSQHLPKARNTPVAALGGNPITAVQSTPTDFNFCGATGTKGAVCTEGEGDCDGPDDCAAGLVCGTNNCPASFDPLADCCTPETVDATVACDASNPNMW